MKKRSIILLSSVALLASSCAGNGFNKEKMIEFANEHTLNVLQIEAKYDSFKSKTVTTLDDKGNEEFATYAAGKETFVPAEAPEIDISSLLVPLLNSESIGYFEDKVKDVKNCTGVQYVKNSEYVSMDATCSEVLELSDAEKETWGEVAVARFYEQKYKYDGKDLPQGDGMCNTVVEDLANQLKGQGY